MYLAIYKKADEKNSIIGLFRYGYFFCL